MKDRFIKGNQKIKPSPANAPSITGNKPGSYTPAKTQTPGGKTSNKASLEDVSSALNQLSSTADKLGGTGTDLNVTATNVRSGASHGAKAIDPWRSFSTESGSPNDNN